MEASTTPARAALYVRISPNDPEHVQVAALAACEAYARTRSFDPFLVLKDRADGATLDRPGLVCAACGRAMAGYTDSKYKVSATGEKVCYKYRKYRCAGRVNKPGGCKMPKLSADKLEQVVAEAVFGDTARTAPQRLLEAVRAAVETRREQLTRALGVLASQRQRLEQDRDEALDGLLRLRDLSPLLRQALSERAEVAVQALDELLGKEKVLQVGLETLDHQARTVERVLQQPNLDPSRWQEPTVNRALQRALQVMVRRIEVARVGKGNYTVRLWLPEAEDLLFREIDKCENP